jgi:hypothetical protein
VIDGVLHVEGDAGPQEAPPTEADAARATSSGTARHSVGGTVKRSRGRPKGARTDPAKLAARKRKPSRGDDAVKAVRELVGDDPEAQALAEELTRELASPDELADALAGLLAIPGALVHESYNLSGPDGKPNARCRLAARRMFPLVRRYGSASIARWLPEIMFAWGLVELLRPCVMPTIAIATGAMPPLIFRSDEDAPAAAQTVPMQAVQ